MSQARFDELQKELNYLKTTRSDEVAEQIKVARGFGDLTVERCVTRPKTSRANSTPASPRWRTSCSTR